jgi:hypothetical protein
VIWTVIEIGILVLQFAYQSYRAYKAWKAEQSQDKKAKLGNYDFPRVEEGSAVTIFYGRVRLKGPQVVYIGGLQSSPSTPPYFNYQINMVMVLGLGSHGVGSPSPGVEGSAKLYRWWVGEKLLWDSHGVTSIPSTTFSGTYGPDGQYRPGYHFYGAPGEGGSITGSAYWLSGTFTQGLDTNFQTVLTAAGEDLTLFPPLRGQVAICLANWQTGESPMLDAYSFEAQSSRKIGGTGIHAVSLIGEADENPAFVLYDLLTNPWIGLGLSSSAIDSASFINAAGTLATEENGISLSWDNQVDASEIVAEIIKQIDGVLYDDPTTGLKTLKLIRDDYTVGSLPLLDNTNVLAVVQYATSSWQDTYNQVRVTYDDRKRQYVQRSLTVSDLANINAEGVVRSTSIHYPGVKTAKNASRLASRDLRGYSVPLARVRLAVDRSVWNARPGDMYRWTWPDYGIVDMPLRVLKHDVGKLSEGKVILDCVQDRFAFDYTAQEDPPYENASPLPPQLSSERYIDETPRWWQVQNYLYGTGHDPDIQLLWYFAVARGTSVSMEGEDSGNNNSVFQLDQGLHSFPPKAIVETAYSSANDPYDTTVGLRINNVSDSSLLVAATANDISNYGKNLAIIGPAMRGAGASFAFGIGEIIGYESVTDMGGGVWKLNNIYRGLLDTVPVDHAIGERVYLLNQNQAADLRNLGHFGVQYGDTRQVRIVVSNGQQVREPATTEFTDTLRNVSSRSQCPYPAANMTVNAVKTPTQLEEGGVAVAWVRRDYTKGTITRPNQADETPAAGETYSVTGRKPPITTLTTLVSAAATTSASDVLLSKVGHGTIKVGVLTQRTVAAGGGGGIGPPGGTIALSWQMPEISIVAPTWRNLLVNGNFASAITTGWTVAAGAPISQSGANGLGAAGGYAFANSTTNTDFSQTVDISGYTPNRMRAVCDFAVKMLAADANDTVQVDLVAQDASHAQVAIATYGPSIPTANWIRQRIEIANLPSTTVELKVRVRQVEVATGGTTSPDGIVTDFHLRVGQCTAQQLLNPDFQAGTFTNWTNVTNSFKASTTAPIYLDTQYAQAGDFASAEIRQDITIAAGDEYSVVFLEWAQKNQNTDLDTGETIIEARGTGGTVLLTSATTGPLTITPSNTWTRKRLTLTLPAGTDTVRIRLVGVRATGTTLDACWDDMECRFHKQLDASLTTSIDLSTTYPQQWLPADRDNWDLRFGSTVPAPNYGMFAGDDLQGNLGIEPTMVASDANAYAGVAVLPGYYHNSTPSTPCFELRTGTSGITTAGDVDFANFKSSDTFSVVTWIQLTEEGLAAARGITGRTDVGVGGWNLEIDATGHPVAKLTGNLATKSATSAIDIRDRGLHMVGLSYDGTTLRLAVDGVATVTTATAGMGEIYLSELIGFGIGANCGQPAADCKIPNVWLWKGTALSAAQFNLLYTLEADPTGVVTYTRTGRAACVVGNDANAAPLVGTYAAAQRAYAYSSVAGGPCFTTQRTVTNLAKSCNIENGTYWVSEGSPTTVARNGLDPEGGKRSYLISGSNTTSRSLTNITVSGVGSDVFVMWFAKGNVAHNARLELTNSSDVSKATFDYAVTTNWQLFTKRFAGNWDASTATCKLKFRPSNDGTSRTIELCGLVFVHQADWQPILIPYSENGTPGVIGDTYGQVVAPAAFTAQLNSEGEITVIATSSETSPSGTNKNTLAVVWNNVNSNDKRDLYLATTDKETFDHYDNAAASTAAAQAVASDWATLRTVRARWQRKALLDQATFFSDVGDGSTGAAMAVGRAAAWTPSTTAPNRLDIGHDTAGDVGTFYFKSVTVTARESIIPG